MVWIPMHNNYLRQWWIKGSPNISLIVFFRKCKWIEVWCALSSFVPYPLEILNPSLIKQFFVAGTTSSTVNCIQFRNTLTSTRSLVPQSSKAPWLQSNYEPCRRSELYRKFLNRDSIFIAGFKSKEPKEIKTSGHSHTFFKLLKRVRITRSFLGVLQGQQTLISVSHTITRGDVWLIGRKERYASTCNVWQRISIFDSGEVINHDKLSFLTCAHTKLGLIIAAYLEGFANDFLENHVLKRCVKK